MRPERQIANKIADTWYREWHCQLAPIFQKQKLADAIEIALTQITNKNMKTYYAVCTVTYQDNSGDEVYVGAETYTMTIGASSLKGATKAAKETALREFNEDIIDGFANIEVTVNDIYETTDDARAD